MMRSYNKLKKLPFGVLSSDEKNLGNKNFGDVFDIIKKKSEEGLVVNYG